MASNTTKPAGIVIISILSALGSAFYLIASVLFLLLSAIPEIPLWVYIVSMLSIVFGVVFLTSIYGLWTLQPWGWKLTFWLYMLAIPIGIAAIFPIFPESQMSLGNTLFQIFGIAIDVAVLFYISKDDIQVLYGI